MLSKRVLPTLEPSPLYESFSRALGNAYDPTSNPDGIVSLGIAENSLMYEDLASFLDQNMKITPNLFGYGAVATPVPGLMDGLLRIYNSDPFNPVIPVVAEHLAFTAGCTSLLDCLFWCLCDDGEGVLIGKPLYGGFLNDLKTRSKCTLLAVSLKGYDPFSKEAVVRYEEEILEAKAKGVNPRVLVLCTPHNPLGQYHPSKV
jgi:aspartate/methionine/tyrosine aminotransferase